MCQVRYLKLPDDRVLAVQTFPEGICIQRVFPSLGKYLCYPFESWMIRLLKPSPYLSDEED